MTQPQSLYQKWITTYTTIEEVARHLKTDDLDLAKRALDASRRAYQEEARRKAHHVTANDGYNSAMKAVLTATLRKKGRISK